MNRWPAVFDCARLALEARQFEDRDWIPSPGEAAGQEALVLVSVAGGDNLDFALSGQVSPSPFLLRSPCLQQVLAAFGHPISRSRLVKLRANTSTTPTIECNYHFFRRSLVYIPVLGHESVSLFQDRERLVPRPGEAWRIDPAKAYWMSNESATDCILLIVEMRDESKDPEPFARDGHGIEQALDRSHSDPVYETLDRPCAVALETYRFEVLSAREIRELTASILASMQDTDMPEQLSTELTGAIESFRQTWTRTFGTHGHHPLGELAYQNLILSFEEEIAKRARPWLEPATSGLYSLEVIASMLWRCRPQPRRINPGFLARSRKASKAAPENFRCPAFDRPLFIVSAPRAGSTLLFESLARLPGIWTTGDENHETIEGIPELHPEHAGYASNRLTEADAIPPISMRLCERFTQQLQDREGRAYLDIPESERPAKLRFLEKTPKNALRIPFLKTLFPDARFLYLYREPAENIASLLEGWRSRRFIAYRDLPGCPFREWSFLLVPGWRDLSDRPLAEIAAYQWRVANAHILDDLEALPSSCRCLVRYRDLIREPQRVLHQIAEFADLEWGASLEHAPTRELPLSSRTLSAPAANKWRKSAWEIRQLLPTCKAIETRVEKWATPMNPRFA